MKGRLVGLPTRSWHASQKSYILAHGRLPNPNALPGFIPSLRDYAGASPTCGARRLFEKEGVANWVHLALCVASRGIWIPVWIGCAVANAFQPFHGTQCGARKWR